ncbi:MAG TPA: hypothetical protein VNM50_05755 [Chloroflexota bacterium]|jgi:hypothetical protein|nr:hypothetical protein [Chloroflexota bacterium]
MPLPLSDAELAAMEARAASLAYTPTPDAALLGPNGTVSCAALADYYARDVLRLVAEVRRLRAEAKGRPPC